MYRIGEFSKIVKVTVKTLRFYEETGLLKPAMTDKFTNYRYYTTEQLYPLQQIVSLRQSGFSIAEIKLVLSGKDVSEILNRKYDELTNEKRQTEEKLLRLRSMREYYSKEQTMNYQAIVKELPSYIVYCKKCKVKHFSDYGEIIPAIGAEVTAANPDLKCVEPGYCFIEYIDGEYKESDFNIMHVEAVESFGVETGDIKFKTLPPTKVACVLHKGSYEGLRKAYSFLIAWVEQNGYAIADNFREQYIDGCWNKESPDDYLTEVQIPIK